MILLNQSNVLFVSSTSSSSSSLSSSTSTQTSTPQSLSIVDVSSKANDTAVSASTFSIQGIKDFIFRARSVDLARTFSSLRGSISTPFTALMYMGSLAVGAIVMLAFYESPISPLPVPPLPDPPVGRFPPEHPVWPPPSRSSQPIAHHQSHLPNHPIVPGSLASASDIHPVAVRPPAGYIHRRTGMEVGGSQYPLKGQKQLNPLNSVASKAASSKASKLSSTSVSDERVEFIEEANKNAAFVNNKNSNSPGACNGTVCEQNGTTINSTVSLLTSFIKDKPQKLFDILMPRTSENNKQN